MYIKKQTTIPTGFKVTKCPPAAANAPSVFSLLRKEEQRLQSNENQEERMREEAAAFYVANGYHATGIDEFGNLF